MMDGNSIEFLDSDNEHDVVKDLTVIKRFDGHMDNIAQKHISSSAFSSASDNAHQELPSSAVMETDASGIMAGGKKVAPWDILPQTMKEKIENELGGSDPKLILTKTLSRTDVAANQNRLVIPYDKLELDEAEKAQASMRLPDGSGGIKGLKVVVMDPAGGINKAVEFKDWKFGSSHSYVLTGPNYKALVSDHRLEAGQDIQVWFFRDAHRNLCFAIVKVGSPPLA